MFTDIGELILLCSRRSMSSSTVNEGLQLLVKILKLADEEPQDHLTILCTQVCTCMKMAYYIRYHACVHVYMYMYFLCTSYSVRDTPTSDCVNFTGK